MNRFFVVILFLLSTFFSFAQKQMQGKVVDSYTHVSVSNVYIENCTKNIFFETDTSGKFSIKASIGDTLIFSSVGFHWKKIIISDLSYQVFLMEQQVYDLQEVVKYAPVNYEGFKAKILSMKPEKDTLHIACQYERYIPMREYTPGTVGYTFEGGITILYNSYNKHARNSIKAMELLENKHQIVLANKKLNKELVLDLTQIPEEYFNDFMSFCLFSDEYLAVASEYQIITMLYLKYEQYILQHPQLQKL